MGIAAILGPWMMAALYLCGALLSAGAGLWIARFGDRDRPDRGALLTVCAAMVVWCAAVVAFDPGHGAVELAASGRNLALIALIFRLFAADGRADSLRPVRPVIVALVAVEMLQPVLVLVSWQVGDAPQIAQLVFEVASVLKMLVAVGAIMLLHNLYAGAAATSRRIIRWSAVGLAVIFGYDLNYHMLAYVGGDYPALLYAFRGSLAGAMTVLLALGASAAHAVRHISPSRAVTFQTLSLLVIGSYLIVMLLATRALALFGEDFARMGQIVFLVLASVIAVAWLPSQRLRGWLRVTVAKHLFQHRYDYREEWLRFTRTIGHGPGTSSGSHGASLHERAVKAIADITDSPAGLLLMPNEGAQLELTARWNWAMLEVPAAADQGGLASLLEQQGLIIALDETRAGTDHCGEVAEMPAWLIEAEDAWALVPLVHYERLVGTIVLARPRIERQLDWEDFDLLRVVGQQLASYLAEQAGQQALMDASRFDEFNRRMAFVMHDIKNLASQLSLLSRNAQKHADNPDFRADMLVTLRNSSEKLDALLARLGRYGAGQGQPVRETDLAALASSISARFRPVHPVTVTSSEPVWVMADPEALEQALVHLVQNAIDASEPDEEIRLSIKREAITGTLEVIDAGTGMTPEFVRSGLFKPFVSSKEGGFGIGAFEAREMIRGMGGRLSVESREGMGTCFGVTLPVARLGEQSAPQSEMSHEKVA